MSAYEAVCQRPQVLSLNCAKTEKGFCSYFPIYASVVFISSQGILQRNPSKQKLDTRPLCPPLIFLLVLIEVFNFVNVSAQTELMVTQEII